MLRLDHFTFSLKTIRSREAYLDLMDRTAHHQRPWSLTQMQDPVGLCALEGRDACVVQRGKAHTAVWLAKGVSDSRGCQ